MAPEAPTENHSPSHKMGDLTLSGAEPWNETTETARPAKAKIQPSGPRKSQPTFVNSIGNSCPRAISQPEGFEEPASSGLTVREVLTNGN